MSDNLMESLLSSLEELLQLKQNGMTITILMSVPMPDGKTRVNYGSTAPRDQMAEAVQQIASRFQPRAHHLKRGSDYAIMAAEAGVQTSTPLVEGDKVVVYRSLTTDEVYVRLASEFNDGRFELPQ